MDHVNWSEYNEKLVRRGEIIIGFDVIESWDKELARMNNDKIGEPFHYPDTFVQMLGYAKNASFYQTDKQHEL
jgi:hypothetical protein